MSTDHDADGEPVAQPAGPFFTNWGPRDGLILYRDHCPALGVYPEPSAEGFPIGAAYPIGWIPCKKGPPAVTFRLQVGKVDLQGQWICRGQRFIQIGEAAEEV